MQTNILRDVALTAVGNAALRGRDVSAFWPRAAIFRYSRQVEFVMPAAGGRHHQIAPDPNAWLAWLKQRGCSGLRLHVAPARQSGKLGHIDERMMVGFVGGGPQWFIGTAGRGPAWPMVWHGFDRVGDRNDPERRLWLTGYIGQAGQPPAGPPDPTVAEVAAELRDVLVEIEAVARAVEWKAAFAEDFVHARAILDGAPARAMGLDFVDWTDLADDARRLIRAATAAWVFGGMGSWNDGTPDPPWGERYEAASAALFATLQRAVLAVANATHRQD